jgi:hypothetical protein
MDVKHRPLLYIETSVFGFYYDEEPRNALRREGVRELFRQLELGILNAVVSRLTLRELNRSPEPRRTGTLSLARLAELLEADDEKAERLASLYVAEGVIPAAFEADALHAAYATVSECEVLVTLNLKHLANEWAGRKLNAVNAREGYPPVSIRTPEEVVRYEE